MIIGFNDIDKQKCKKFIDSLISKTRTKRLKWDRNSTTYDINPDVPHSLFVDGESYSAFYGDVMICLDEMYFNDTFERTWLNLLVRLAPSASFLSIGFGFDDELSILQMAIKEQCFDDEFNPSGLYRFIDHFADAD